MTNASTITRQDVLDAKAEVRNSNVDLIGRINIRASQRNGFTLSCNQDAPFHCWTLAEAKAYALGACDAESFGDECRPEFGKDTPEHAAHAAGIAANGGAYDEFLDEEPEPRRWRITWGGKAAA